MNALMYLFKREIINGIKHMMRRPILPIIYCVFIGFLIFSSISGMSDQSPTDVDRAERMMGFFQAGAFLLFAFVFFAGILISMSGGATLFSMSDVNMLFSSPISPQRILVYGVLRQAKQNIIITLIYIFQIPLLKNFFDLDARGIVGFLFAWLMILMSGSLMSMTLYAISSKSQIIRKTIIGVIVTGIVIWFLGLVVNLITNGATLTTITQYASLSYMDYIPFIGWSVAFMMAMIQGDMLAAAMFILLSLLTPLLGIEFMRRSRMDYYEDVLNKTEITFLTLQAAKEGKQVSNGTQTKESRIRKYGLAGKGQGASAIFWRQITELRRSLFFIFDGASVLTALLAVVGALILRYSVSNGTFGLYRAQIFAMAAGIYLLYFLSVTGKFAVELKKVYIYLIPASRFKKLFFAILPHILKSFVEGFLGILILVILVGLPLWMLALGPILYASFSGVYAAVLIFAKWMTGEGAPKMVQTILFFIGGGIVTGPAITAFIIPFAILVRSHPQYLFVPYIASSLVAVLILIAVLGLCRGALNKIEN